MRRKKKLWLAMSGSIVHLLLLLLLIAPEQYLSMLLLTTSCLSATPDCVCSWKGGKFVADCSSKNLQEVPKNDYDDLLASAANSQMPTLNRDIQQLNMSNNNISYLNDAEFFKKKFRNLQKIYLSANQVAGVHSNAFQLLTGLVELDLSENLITSLGSSEYNAQIGDSDMNNNNITNEKTTTTTTTVSSTEQVMFSEDKRSFLKGLTNLRTLNLASNLLQQLQSFAFSPLKQLRQLYLSRNKISFIDKRAFDGLRLLNVLHLDGNKLSYLNGAILLQLPKLHSIQLGGQSNKWRCNCRLRKLFRMLQTPTAASVLQDDPHCVESSLSSDGNGVEKRLSWTNMKSNQFECRPRLAAELMADKLAANSWSTQLEQRLRNLLPEVPEAKGQRRVYLRPQYLWPTNERPVVAELTLALMVSDELDLALTQLQWWHLDEQRHQRRLLWQSPHQTTNYSVLKDEPISRQYTVIDYVTRANGSQWATQVLQPPQSPLDGSLVVVEEDEQSMSKSSDMNLVRVVHLMANTKAKSARRSTAQATSDREGEDEEDKSAKENEKENENHLAERSHLQTLFLCRITNTAGSLDVLFAIGHSDQQSAAAATQTSDHLQRRLAMRKRLAAAQSVSHWLPLLLSSSGAGWSLEQAKAALAEELQSQSQPLQQQLPLFIPVHLPSELTRALSGGLATATSGSQLARSLNQELDHLNQRTATRQTNKTSGTSAATSAQEDQQVIAKTGTSNAALLIQSGANRSARSALNLIALDLIGRYTGGAYAPADQQLIPDDDHSNLVAWNLNNDLDLITSSGSGTAAVDSSTQSFSQVLNSPQPLGGRIKSLSRLVYVRYLDRWTQLALGEAPLLLGICAGLLVGCLLSMLVVLRLRCAQRNRRCVADLSTSSNDDQLRTATLVKHHHHLTGTGQVINELKVGDNYLSDLEEDFEQDDCDEDDQVDDVEEYCVEGDADEELDDDEGIAAQMTIADQMSPFGRLDSNEQPASGGSSSCMMSSDASQRKLIAGSPFNVHHQTRHQYQHHRPLFYRTLDAHQVSHRKRSSLARRNNHLMVMNGNAARNYSAVGDNGDGVVEQKLLVMPSTSSSSQQELKELSVSSLLHHNHNKTYATNQQQQQVPAECAHHLSASCTYYGSLARGVDAKVDSSTLVAYELDDNQHNCDNQLLAYPANNHYEWKATSGDDHFATTTEDSASLLTLSNGNSCYLQPLVAAPPKLRSFDATTDTLLLPYLTSGVAAAHQHHQDQQPLLLHLRQPLESSAQANSSSSLTSLVPSNSSSLMATIAGNHHFVDATFLDSNSFETVTGSGSNEQHNGKMYYLDDALQLLNTSANICFEQDLLPQLPGGDKSTS